MTDDSPWPDAQCYTVDGAAVETRESEYEFIYDQPRGFQADALKWMHDGSEPVAGMQAPTGAGKTAVFVQFAKAHRKVLIIYPTNALISQQQEVLEDAGLSTQLITADQLSEHGPARLRELLDLLSKPVDAVLSNPDILQAALQGQYWALGREFDLFQRVGGVVYDEFHFYDTLAASGILQQIDVFGQQPGDHQILLSSATPDESFLTYLESQFRTSVRRIEAESRPLTAVSPDGQFRYETEVVRHSDHLRDSFESVAEVLADRLAAAEQTSDPRAAVIFNSAAVGNRFHDWLSSAYPNLYEHCRKDNGYDTDGGQSDRAEFFVLNTTSKGEVGLHFDLDTLVMQSPWTAYKFIQRAGRAGRESPATVHIFGLNLPGWDESMSYADFQHAVSETLDTPLADHDRLRRLIALRAALAVVDRESESAYHSDAMYQLFTEYPEYGRWKRFIEDVSDDVASDDEFSMLGGSPDPNAVAVCEFCESVLEGLESLRGQTLNRRIEYPRGRERVQTTYDTVSALREYQLVGHDDELLRVGGESDGLLLRYPGLDDQLDPAPGYGAASLESRLTDIAVERAREAGWSELNTDLADIETFLTTVPLVSAGAPSMLLSGSVALDWTGEQFDIDRR